MPISSVRFSKAANVEQTSDNLSGIYKLLTKNKDPKNCKLQDVVSEQNLF